MFTSIAIEDIGAGERRRCPELPRRAWVARISLSPLLKLQREFVRPYIDYSKANSAASRGVTRTYMLEDGYYEISAPVSWRQTDRYFCRVQDGGMIRLTEKEVRKCLKHLSE